MSQDTVIYLAKEALTTVMLLAGPLLGAGMLMGILVSILQAVTQIHEQTLTFIPKLITIMLAVLILGPWMLTVLTQFTHTMLSQLSYYVN